MHKVYEFRPTGSFPPPSEESSSPAVDESSPGGNATPWLTSLAIHLAVLVLLGMCSMILPADNRLVLSAAPVDRVRALVPEEFRFDVAEAETAGAISTGGSAESRAAAPVEALEPTISVDEQPVRILAEITAVDFETDMLRAPTLDDNLVLKGTASVGTTGADGAIDRITNEILLSLEQRRTLVVWLFDQSGSLQRQREQIVRRFDRVFEELGVIEAAENPAFKRHKDKPLLTSVAAFGLGFELLTPKPTDEIEEIKAAVSAIRQDDSGVENVFAAVTRVARDFRHYRLKAPRRNVMFVVFTDEAGDDMPRLDEAVATCRKYEMPVYVVGVPAPFGRKDTYVRYVDPDPNFDQRTQWVPVHQGPESLLPERLKLSLSGRHGRHDLIDSGFGPFALTRLAYETGGVYFTVHPDRKVGQNLRKGDTSEMSAYLARFFDPRVMRSYRPDYVSVQEYRTLLGENAARRALVEAATRSWTRQMENPRTSFPKIDDAEFARDLTTAQRKAAELEPVIAELVAILRRGERDRPQLLEPRWQAGYDLAMGRALAVKARTLGYNAMLAMAKQGLSFKNPGSDTWELVPSAELSTGSALAKEAADAKAYLERVITQHSETPWAMLAELELQMPLGWQWKEKSNNLLARREQPAGGGNNRPRPAPTPRPPSKPLRKPPAL